MAYSVGDKVQLIKGKEGVIKCRLCYHTVSEIMLTANERI